MRQRSALWGTLIYSQANPLVYFDIKLDRYGEGTKLGRIVMELKAVRRAVAHTRAP